MLSVLILTLNEQKNIHDCIESAKFADEIIVIDSGSIDDTVFIAENLGAKVVYHSMQDGFGPQRNFALTQTRADWVLFLDADERITPELAEEILQVTQNGPYAYDILRINYFLGKKLQYGIFHPDWSLRLYPRSAINWSGIIHESANVTCEIRRLEGNLLHFPYESWEQYFAKLGTYTSAMAIKLYDQGKKSSLSAIMFRPLWAIFKAYVLKSGWRDGKMGFITSVFHGFYTLVKYVKLDYLYRNRLD